MANNKHDPSMPSDANPYSGRPRNLDTFLEALGRGFGRAMDAGLVRKNPFVSSFKSGVVHPIAEVVDDVKRFKNRERIDPQEVQESVGNSILLDLTVERLTLLERNAVITWWLGLALGIVGMAFFGHAVINGLNSLPRYNACLAGICMGAFGSTRVLRSARDVEVLRKRAPLTFDNFLDRILDLWCPYPADSWQRNFVGFVVLPGTALAFFLYPAVIQISRILGLA